MSRNKHFSKAQRQPGYPTATLHLDTVAGPVAFLNPTTALFDLAESRDPVSDRLDDRVRSQLQWRAREYRKGRHTRILPRSSAIGQKVRSSSHPRSIAQGILRMFTFFPYWDVSWLIAVLFTFGCILFILCGLFFWLPLAYPNTSFRGEATAGGALSFAGATLFQVGAVLLVFEACNPRSSEYFGAALEQALARRRTYPTQTHDSTYAVTNPERAWRWCPTWTEFRTYYVYEIGFLASITMSIGATIFYISGILTLPGLFDKLSHDVLDGLYWLTYLIGGIFFTISSLLYILENQPNWYTPAPSLIGWHIGVWNLVGSIGWTLSAALGYCPASWCEYQSNLSLTWASIAFTIGSALLWYESLDKIIVKKE